MYLLNIRNLKDKKLLHLNEVHNVARKYDFSIPAVYDFENLDTMIYLAHNMKNANKEGWVIRIGVDKVEYMLKLKLDEYFDMHKTFGKIKLGWVYKHLLNGDLDDFMGLCNEYQKNEIFKKLDIVENIRKKIKEKVVAETNVYLKKYNITHNEFAENKEKMIEMIKEILSSKSNVKQFVVHYLKEPIRVETSINKIYYKHMKKYFEEFDENVNE